MANVLVRVRPYNPRKGLHTRRLVFRGKKFDVERGWYEVPRTLASELAKITDRKSGERVFDIATAEQAQQMERVERAARNGSTATKPQRIHDPRPSPATQRVNEMEEADVARATGARRAELEAAGEEIADAEVVSDSTNPDDVSFDDEPRAPINPDDVSFDDETNLGALTKPQLTDLARARGIKIQGNWTKGELIDAIERGATD